VCLFYSGKQRSCIQRLQTFFSLAVNLNPLIRLDGYYALQLALGIYGLRRRAWSYVRSIVMNEEPEEKVTARERKVFLLYAPLSVIYTVCIMVLIMSFYFGEGFLNFPSLTAFLAVMIFIASQTPLQKKKKDNLAPAAGSPTMG
jgi:putative peptide zinc metalloprotease protein